MHILSAQQLSKQFGDRPLFTDVDFSLERGERVGLIGTNGSGKSTLLRIVAGLEQADSGLVTINGAARVAYLAQNPAMDDDVSVMQHMLGQETAADRMALMGEYEQVLAGLQVAPHDETALARLAVLVGQLEVGAAWEVERRAGTILTRLGVHDWTAKLGTLSGGQRRRVALAATLLDPADVLILDEPTNHLDADTVAWLETELSRIPSALLLVTHDRYFLDRIASRILALEAGTVWSSAGGYREYVRRRAERAEVQSAGDRRRASIMRKELAWMLQGAPARSTKQKARIERFETLRDEPATQQAGKLAMTVPPAQRLGKRVFEVKDVTKGFGSKPLFEHLSLTIERGERLGIVGANGSGKTTLLQLLAGRLEPDSGEVVRGETVRLAYYDQESTALHLEQRIGEYLEDEAPLIRTDDGSVITAAVMLERFLFDRKVQYARVGTLSGGERRRLYLLRTLLFGPNVLLLDEPTNDLDVETLTILEDYLDDWGGSLIIASHDRYFLDRTVDHLLVFEAGATTTFAGNYSAYAADRAARQRASNVGARRGEQRKQTERTPKPKSLSYGEKRELAGIEARIAEIEARQQQINDRLATGSDDYREVERLANELSETSVLLETTMERWLALAELAGQT
ncbi:MAG: ABC-F family ATP-binding cassette domain-containing protein [Herpetosiphon sp.]